MTDIFYNGKFIGEVENGQSFVTSLRESRRAAELPVELNLKYVIEASPQWLIALGAGVSYNWFDVELDVCDECSGSEDWVFGGQVFADITYKMSNQWFIGINGKYQFTDDLKFDVKGIDIETDTNANNWRVGAQVGLMF